MNIIFDPVTLQYVVDFGTYVKTYNGIEDLKNSQLPSEQTLRTEYFFSDNCRGHSHQSGNGCRRCLNYNDLRGRDYCPYSEF